MHLKKLFVVAFFSFIAITANAYEFPAKPFSSWSQAEQKELVSYLDATCIGPHPGSRVGYGKYCGQRCDDYKAGKIPREELIQGLMFNAFRLACFSRFVPADYPNKEYLYKNADINYKNAQKLECKNCPTFSPN